MEANNVKKKILWKYKMYFMVAGFCFTLFCFPTNWNFCIVYESYAPATFKVFGRLVLNEICFDSYWK